MFHALWKAIGGTPVVLGVCASSVTLILARHQIGNALDALFPAVRPVGEALVVIIAVFAIVVALSALAKKPIEQLRYVSSGQRDIDRLRKLHPHIEPFKQSLMGFEERTSGYQGEYTNSLRLTMVKELETFAKVVNQMGIATPDPTLRYRRKWVYFLSELEVSSRHGDLAEAIRIGMAYSEPADSE